MYRSLIRVIGYTFLFSILFCMTPFIIRSYAELLAYYEQLLDLWILNPLFAFACSALISRQNGFTAELPVSVAFGDLVALFLFYDDTKFPFLIAYVLLSLGGSLWGQKLFEKRIREEY